MILSSILDTDLYKLTMQDAVRRLYPGKIACYELIFRRNAPEIPKKFIHALRRQVDAMAGLQLSPGEETWLSKLNLFSSDYPEYLRRYRFRPEQVHAFHSPQSRLAIRMEGPWEETILWETPLLAIVCELYHQQVDTRWNTSALEYHRKTVEKGLRLFRAGCRVADFGARRRRSSQFHQVTIEALCEASERAEKGGADGGFIGSSNVDLARRYKLSPIGTMAHEWIMAHGAMHGVVQATPMALNAWLQVHHGNNAIALADTYTHPLFFQQFDQSLAIQYAGTRHDSGDPVAYATALEKHYREMGIDPRSKKLVFSDDLSIESAIALQQQLGTHFQVNFGIGTKLTNDVPDSPALDVVMKMNAFDGTPAVKLGDCEAKSSGSSEAIIAARRAVANALQQGNFN